MWGKPPKQWVFRWGYPVGLTLGILKILWLIRDFAVSCLCAENKSKLFLRFRYSTVGPTVDQTISPSEKIPTPIAASANVAFGSSETLSLIVIQARCQMS